MLLGAKGFLAKENDKAVLLRVLRAIAEGGVYFPNDISSDIVKKVKDGYLKIGLTNREIEFLRYCCEDYNYREIGEKMGISVRTVHTYRDALFTRLGIKTKTGLAIYAVSAGFISMK